MAKVGTTPSLFAVCLMVMKFAEKNPSTSEEWLPVISNCSVGQLLILDKNRLGLEAKTTRTKGRELGICGKGLAAVCLQTCSKSSIP